MTTNFAIWEAFPIEVRAEVFEQFRELSKTQIEESGFCPLGLAVDIWRPLLPLRERAAAELVPHIPGALSIGAFLKVQGYWQDRSVVEEQSREFTAVWDAGEMLGPALAVAMGLACPIEIEEP